MNHNRITRHTPYAALIAILFIPGTMLAAPTKWDAFRTTVPQNLDEIKALQENVHEVSEHCTACTVGIRFLDSQGSGVIVSADGLVLTAGHVSGKPGRKCKIILPDGKFVDGKTLGQNKLMDSGMVQITTKGPNDGKWPFVEIAQSSKLKVGQWLVSLGHPNGYKEGRLPVARLGRLDAMGTDKKSGNIRFCYLRTTCTLVGGDSGGPLFNLEGKLIGIHSQIGPSITWNMHVPVDEFRTDWEMLVHGDTVSRTVKLTRPKVVLGVVYSDDENEPAKLEDLIEGGPAATAGLKVGDIITKFDGKPVPSVKAFRELLLKYEPDAEIKVEVKRGNKNVTVTVVLDKR